MARTLKYVERNLKQNRRLHIHFKCKASKIDFKIPLTYLSFQFTYLLTLLTNSLQIDCYR